MKTQHVSPVGQRHSDAATRRRHTNTPRRRLTDYLTWQGDEWVLPASHVWEFSLMDPEGNMQSRIERDKADAA